MSVDDGRRWLRFISIHNFIICEKKSNFVIHELYIEINDVQMRRDLQNISMSRYYNNAWLNGTAHCKSVGINSFAAYKTN